jgi:cytochrome b561
MPLSNTRSGYGWIAITLHWAAAVAVISLYFSGDDAGEAPTRALRAPLLEAHVSLGMALFALLAVRVFWSLSQPKPEKLAKGFLVRLLAGIVQYGFLAMIAVEIITGPLTLWSAGRPIDIYDWASIASPFPNRVQWLHEGAEFVHKYAAKLFWPLLGLHILGALKSAALDRDKTVLRMLWSSRAQI